MTTRQSLLLGIRSSGGYFISTFLFGLMFGLTATAVGLDSWQAVLMSVSTFSASAQFAALEFWHSPLPYGTIALSVALVSARNILLGMAMAHHFDGHNRRRRTLWLFLLNDPGVVTSFAIPGEIDRLGYITGYGLSLLASWIISTLVGLAIAGYLIGFDPGSVSFAGPLVMTTMLVLFARGSDSGPAPWLVSGLCALVLFELGAASHVILLLSVAAGVAITFLRSRTKDD